MASWPIIPHLTVCNILSGFTSRAAVVVSCAEIPDLTAPAAIHVHFYFPDIDHLPDLELATRIADLCAHEIGLGREVVTHCDQGKNRSVFMAGLILHCLGYPQPLVDLLRAQRPGALTNATFAAYLTSL